MAISTLVVASARHRNARAHVARIAWQDAAAAALAQGGVEAARAALRRAGTANARYPTVHPLETPLGDRVELADRDHGRLRVSRDGDAYRSCGAVGPRRICVEARLADDGRVLSWREDAGGNSRSE